MKRFVDDVIHLKHLVIRGRDMVSLGTKSERELLDEVEVSLRKITGRLVHPHLLENYIVRNEGKTKEDEK